ncbi:MAG: hypothetical protein ACREL7_16660 [Longimicrobiales bacterium]
MTSESRPVRGKIAHERFRGIEWLLHHEHRQEPWLISYKLVQRLDVADETGLVRCDQCSATNSAER